MVMRQRVCAELRYDNRLVRLAVFHQCRQHRKIRGVPAAVLVDADDVKVFHQTVLNLIFRSINQAGRRHHSRLIFPMRAFCQCAHEFQPFIRIGILISDRPDDHARAVPVTVDEFAELILGILICFFTFKTNCPVNRNFLPQKKPKLVGEFCHFFVMRVMCKAHEVASQFFRNADIFDPFLSCQAFSVFHAVFVATDTTQENGLSVQQNVSAVHANFTKADPVADGIGSTGYFYIIQLRFFRCPKLRFCIKNNFSGSVFQLDFPAHAKLLDDKLCLGCDFFRQCHFRHNMSKCSVRHKRNFKSFDMAFRNTDQCDIAVYAAVVEPVGILGRHLLRPSRSVNSKHDAVLRFQVFCDIPERRCRSAAMHTDVFSV